MSQQANQFRPTVQELEDRAVPAGNITAQVFDGILYVAGDAAGNQFDVFGGGSGTALIRALDSTTTINGQSTQVAFQGITKGLHIQGGANSDVIAVEGFRTTGTIVVLGGGGDDSVFLNSVQAGKGGILATGNGNDQAFVSTSDFGSLFAVNVYGGNDFLSLTGNHFNKSTLFNGGTGSNTISALNNAGSRALGIGSFVPGAAPVPATPAPAPAPTPEAPVPPAPSAAPTVTISTAAGTATNQATIPFTAVFSSAVSGFTAAQVTATNGTVANFVQVSPTTYTFNVGAANQGAVNVSIAAGAGTTSDGVASLASNTATVTFDSVAPSVVITPPSTNPILASPIVFTARFSEAVTGFTAASVSVTNGTVASVSTTDSITFTVNVTPAGDGTVNVSVLAGKVTDRAGNPNTLGSAAATSLRTATGLATTLPDATDPAFIAVGTQGLKIRDIVVGTGSTVVGSNSQIQVFYRGFLNSDGTVFDAATTTGAPANFTLSSLIPGFQQGVIGMRAGGQRQIFIPSALGYGTAGLPPTIPGNADLVFDVKLISTT